MCILTETSVILYQKIPYECSGSFAARIFRKVTEEFPWKTNKQTNKQSNKQTNKQANKQTNKTQKPMKLQSPSFNAFKNS